MSEAAGFIFVVHMSFRECIQPCISVSNSCSILPTSGLGVGLQTTFFWVFVLRKCSDSRSMIVLILSTGVRFGENVLEWVLESVVEKFVRLGWLDVLVRFKWMDVLGMKGCLDVLGCMVELVLVMTRWWRCSERGWKVGERLKEFARDRHTQHRVLWDVLIQQNHLDYIGGEQ